MYFSPKLEFPIDGVGGIKCVTRIFSIDYFVVFNNEKLCHRMFTDKFRNGRKYPSYLIKDLVGLNVSWVDIFPKE